jgi:histidinol-phosphate aminotransferase
MKSATPNFIRRDIDSLNAYIPTPSALLEQNLDILDANESPFDLPESLKVQLANIYQQQIKNNRYPDGSHKELKQAIALYVNESGYLSSGIAPENISLGNGSDELIRSLLIATCLNGEGSIFVANPTFSMYAILAQTLGIPIVTGARSSDNFAIDLNQAEKLIENQQNPPIKIIFIVHPNSPTGNPLNRDELAWLRGIPDRILVVVDEAYFEFSKNSVVSELAQHPNWVILRTFSKAFRLAAHRLGYAIAHPGLITALEKIRLPYNLPSFSMAAAKIALDNRDLILSSVEEIIREREILFNSLSQNSNLQIWQSAANFLYLRLQQENREQRLKEIVEKLKSKGTLIRHTGGGLRITVGSQSENKRTIVGFSEI